MGRFLVEDIIFAYTSIQDLTWSYAGICDTRSSPNPYMIMERGNLYVYCMNNPLKFYDYTGNNSTSVLQQGYQSFITYSQSDGPALVGDAVGAVILLGTAMVAGGMAIYEAQSKDKDGSSKNKNDPYARPGQKRQGRERKENKKKGDDWQNRSNKRRGPEPKKSIRETETIESIDH